VVLAFFGFILWALTTQPDTLVALLVTPIWFIALGLGYLLVRRNPKHEALRLAHLGKVAHERYEAAAYRDSKAFGRKESSVADEAVEHEAR